MKHENLQVDEACDFPICSTCSKQLQNFHKFFKMVTQSLETLSSAMVKTEEFIEVVVPEPEKAPKKRRQTAKLPKDANRLSAGPFVCDLCQKNFKLYETLKGHILNFHLKIFDFVCNVCGMGLNNAVTLKKHILYRHEKTERDKCTVCGRLVKNLAEHMNSRHDPRSSLICSVCGRTFVNKKSHADHVRRKHGAARHRYKCTVCGKGYKGKVALKEHMQTHLGGGYLYSCEFCAYQANYKRNLRAHVKKHHNKEWVQQRLEYVSSIYDLNMLPTNSNNPAILLPTDSVNFETK